MFITLMKKTLCQGHNKSQPVRKNPLLCFHKRESPVRNWSTAEQGYLLRNKETTCSQKQDPKFWSASAERNSPRTTFVNWIYKLNLMQWNVDMLLLGMNSVQTRTKLTWRRIGRTTKSTSRNSSQKYSLNVRVEESSRISSRWVFGKKIDRKPRYFQGTQSTIKGIVKRSELCEWSLGFQGSRIGTQWTLIPRSQSTSDVSKSSWGFGRIVKPRPKPATWSLGSAWHVGNVFSGLSASASTL